MKFLITAGPTREPIDPVRFLSNRSSGKMGYALAAAAVEAGHTVVLVSGPVVLETPPGVKLHRVETAQQMFEVVKSICESTDAPDISIHAAAVADYRPKSAASQKIKKLEDSLELELERTQDVLGAMRTEFGFRGFLAGFAAETENVMANAQEKLRRKDCDLVIANDVGRNDSGFDSDENEVILCFPSGPVEPLPKQSKRTLAREIIRRIVALAEKKLR
ncbi:MAG: phosphopantothenoylcysteine decarboxylase [Verrucomicrobia bacterium]|nr:phosphopantothenoylcysteine decarboxylase [Verrucomicrobiota bacterium]